MPDPQEARSAGRDEGERGRVRNGVCLDCGEGVLESGDHITGTREPCASRIAATVRKQGRGPRVLVPRFLVWWPSSRWGYNRDAYGRVLELGHLSVYPKGTG